MVEHFIERGTAYPCRVGKLMMYETNISCRNVKFFFEDFVLTLMLAGHKTITTDHLKFEFFPGTFFIPERRTINNVSIPNASVDNPTKCLVLELDPSFIQTFYQEILLSETDKDILYQAPINGHDPKGYFFSNDRFLIASLVRLYEHQ